MIQTVTAAQIATPVDPESIANMAPAVLSGVGAVGQLHTAANAASQIVGPRRLRFSCM